MIWAIWIVLIVAAITHILSWVQVLTKKYNVSIVGYSFGSAVYIVFYVIALIQLLHR